MNHTGFWYRVWQVWEQLRPVRLSASDLNYVARFLNGREQQLFFAMGPADRYHAVQVARAAEEDADPEVAVCDRRLLARAGLLHDVGKRAGEITVLARIGNVVRVKPWWPRLERLTSRRLREQIRALRRHPERGASLVRAAGGEPELVWLIRYHQDDPMGDLPRGWRPLLAALRRADAAN